VRGKRGPPTPGTDRLGVGINPVVAGVIAGVLARLIVVNLHPLILRVVLSLFIIKYLLRTIRDIIHCLVILIIVRPWVPAKPLGDRPKRCSLLLAKLTHGPIVYLQRECGQNQFKLVGNRLDVC